MHKTYALDVLQNIKHKADTPAQKEALTIAIDTINKSLESNQKSNEAFITLALDTSNTNTGFSVWNKRDFVKSGNLITNPTLELWQKTDEMIYKLNELILKVEPDLIVTEQLHSDNNQKVNAAHSEVLGAVKALALIYKASYYDYAPNEWRKLVNTTKDTLPRKRKELKAWDIRRALDFLAQREKANLKIDDNEADAILIGLAYMLDERWR